jgi:hypothetical protein
MACMIRQSVQPTMFWLASTYLFCNCGYCVKAHEGEVHNCGARKYPRYASRSEGAQVTAVAERRPSKNDIQYCNDVHPSHHCMTCLKVSACEGCSSALLACRGFQCRHVLQNSSECREQHLRGMVIPGALHACGSDTPRSSGACAVSQVEDAV